MTPTLNGQPQPQPQPGDQIGVGLVHGAAGKQIPALIVNGRTFALEPAMAQQLAIALIGTVAVSTLTTEDMRRLLLSAETGLVLPGAPPAGGKT